jgi:Ca2+-binding EF-hand superfamily protein
MEARTKDRVEQKHREEEAQFAYLMSLCREIDDDDSGRLSKEEMLKGFQKNKRFAQAMHDMGFGVMDLNVLFPVLDKDADGAVDYSEFLSLIKKSQLEDSKRMMVFVKFAVMDIWRKLETTENELLDKMACMDRKIGAAPRVAPSPGESAQQAAKGGPDRPNAAPPARGGRGAQRNGLAKAEEGNGTGSISTSSDQSPTGSLNGRSSLLKRAEHGPPKREDLAQNGTRRVDRGLEPMTIDIPGVAAKNGMLKRRLSSEALAGLLSTPAKVAELTESGDELVVLMRKMVRQTEAQSGTLSNIDATMSALVSRLNGGFEMPIATLRATPSKGALPVGRVVALGSDPL